MREVEEILGWMKMSYERKESSGEEGKMGGGVLSEDEMVRGEEMVGEEEKGVKM